MCVNLIFLCKYGLIITIAKAKLIPKGEDKNERLQCKDRRRSQQLSFHR